MKFKSAITMKAGVHRDIRKNGIERDKGKFDGIAKGDEILMNKD